MFTNLNLFIPEELLLPDSNPDLLRLDKVEIHSDTDDSSITEFTTLTVLSNSESISELTTDNDRATPQLFKPLLATLYDQVTRLLTEDVYQLKSLINYTLDDSDDKSFFNVLKNYNNHMVNDLASIFELRLTRCYINVYDYAKSNFKNDMLANLESVTISETIESKLATKKITKYIQGKKVSTTSFDNGKDFPFSPRSHETVVFQLTDGTNLILNQVQQLSLFRLIWAIEAIRKVKYSLVHYATVVLFMDNVNTQIRHLYTPLYSTTFNLDSLEIFNQSPEFKDRLQTATLIIHHHINANSKEPGNYYTSVYAIIINEYDGDNILSVRSILLSNHTYDYYNQFFMYQFAFLPWGENKNKMDLI